MGIEDPSSGTTIPLSTLGTVIYADTRSCTDDNLSCLPHIVLSSDAHWDPHGIQFPAHCGDREVASITTSHTCQDFNSKTDANIGSIYFNPFKLVSRLVASIQVTGPNQEKQDIPSSKTFTMVTPEDIGNRWFIGLAQANKTIKHTTQHILRSAILPLAHRYKVDRMYEWPQLKCTIYTDAMNGCHKSLDGNKHAQVFATEQFFVASYPMESKSMSGQALKDFISDSGVPDRITCDGPSEQVGKRTEFMAQVQKHHIDLSLSEPGRHNQSKVEQVICELHKKWFRIMHKKRVPKQLWDYGLRWTCDVMQCISTEAGSSTPVGKHHWKSSQGTPWTSRSS